MKEHIIKLTEDELSWLNFSLGYAQGDMYEKGKDEWCNETIKLFENIREQTHGTKKTGGE